MAKLPETITVEMRRSEALAIIGATAGDDAEQLQWVQDRIERILRDSLTAYDQQLAKEVK